MYIKGQVAVRPFFRPQHFLKKITWLESALNSERNYVFFCLKKKFFFFEIFLALGTPPENKKKQNFFFSLRFDLDIGYRSC